MTAPKWIAPVFLLAALLDGALGLAFLFATLRVFELYGVAPPNHPGYVQFPAALLLIFATMFVSVARDPVGRRSLILYGVLLKAAYCGVAGFHWATTDVPAMWKPFVVVDGLTGLVFLLAYAKTAGKPRAA